MWFPKQRWLAGEQEPAEGQLPKFDSLVYDFAPPGHGKGCVSSLCASVFASPVTRTAKNTQQPPLHLAR